MKLFILISCFCFAASNVLPQNEEVGGAGKCDKLKVPYMEEFDKEKFKGEWFEIKRYDNKLTTGKCVKAKYALTEDVKKPLKADYHEIFSKNNTKDFTIHLGPIFQTKSQFNVYLNDEKEIQELGHNIINTDYDTYAILYGCKIVKENYKHKLSVLVRKTKLTDDVNKKIDSELEKTGLDVDVKVLKPVEQDEAKCNSATTIAVSTLLNGIIIMILTRKL